MSATTAKRGAPAASNDDDCKKQSKIAKKAMPLTPRKVYFDTKMEWINNHKDIVGEIMIKGMHSSNEDSEDEDSEDEEETSFEYTTEQMNSLRFIMATKNRSDKMDEMQKLVLRGQDTHNVLAFNTSFSYEVADAWQVVKRSLQRKTPAQKLDILMAFTFMIKEYDCWMHDNEGGMDILVKGLAAAWKKLLKESNEKLEWDAEYTKPGVMELLEQFKSSIDEAGGYGLAKFKYM